LAWSRACFITSRVIPSTCMHSHEACSSSSSESPSQDFLILVLSQSFFFFSFQAYTGDDEL